MLKIDQELTKKIAHLAKLQLTDQEVKEFTVQIEEIIHYMEKLQEVNVEGTDSFSWSLDLPTLFREDQVDLFSGDVLSSAPELVERGYKVPQVLG